MRSKNELKQFRTSRWWSNVQALRIDADVSERDFSTLIGKSENYYTTALKNGGVPNVADALTISQLFGTTVEEIAFGSIGLEIRKAQLEAELKRITEEIEDAKRDVEGVAKGGIR